MDDWEEEEHELDKNRYELPLQNNAVNYQMSKAHKSDPEQALIPTLLPEPTVLHDNYSVFNQVNSLNSLIYVNLNPFTSELKQELQGHFDGYGEILG